jgi:hypothetical protein
MHHSGTKIDGKIEARGAKLMVPAAGLAFRPTHSNRMMKKVVAAGLPRHRPLKSMEIWRGKPAATIRQ